MLSCAGDYSTWACESTSHRDEAQRPSQGNRTTTTFRIFCMTRTTDLALIDSGNRILAQGPPYSGCYPLERRRQTENSANTQVNKREI